MSDTDTVHCNAIDHADFGFQAIHDWTRSVILGNTFYKHNRAVMIGDSLIGTGISGINVNQLGTTIGGTSYTPGNIFKTHTTAEYHLYKYDSAVPPTFLIYHTGLGENFSLLKVHLFQSTFDSLNLYTCSGSNILIDKKFIGGDQPENEDSSLINVIENKYIFTQQFSNSMYFNLKLDVYNLLARDIELRNSKPEYQIFYDTVSTNDIGKISQINSLIAKISDSAYSSQFSDLINQATFINNSVQGRQAEESNLKEVNNILLNTIVSGIYGYNSSQKSELMNVATQCPFSGGAAVYQARAMIMLFNDSLNYNDEELCNISNRDFKNEKASEQTSFIVYPNPSDGNLHIAYSTGDLEKYLINIYDATGRLLCIKHFSGGIGNLSFNFRNYNAGIYFYDVNSLHGRAIKKGTFVIIRQC